MTDETNAETVVVEAGKPAPADTPVVTQPDAPEVELDEDEQKEAEEVARKRESSIKKVKRQRDEARREVEYWRGEATRPKEPVPSAAPPAAEGRPSHADYATIGEYTEALFDWKDEQKFAEREQRAEKTKVDQLRQEQVKSWDAKEAEARTRYPDYDDVVTDDVRISATMSDLILSSDVGADVAVYLGKNPSETERIAAMAPMAAAREIGKIEARFAKDAKPDVRRSHSNAPAPISPVSKASKVEADPDKMTTPDWLVLRQKQVNAQRNKRRS